MNMLKKYLQGLLCATLVSATVLSATSCAAWNAVWGQPEETEVNSNLLVIPGSGGSEDTYEVFENAVEFTGEAHEGTYICYNGKGENKKTVIVIDAGHQAQGDAAQEPIGPGADETKAKVSWGAQGEYSGQEHLLNLEVAMLVRNELVNRGYSVVMIRETAEVNISNKERAEIANDCHAAAYVRIHANYYDDMTMNGAMTICQSEENPFPDCAAVYEESRLLSECILQAFCQATGMAKNEIREMDDLAGTNWSAVPTTLVEMGFLSNKSDDMLMATKYFKEQAALGIADGIERYMDVVRANAESESVE